MMQSSTSRVVILSLYDRVYLYSEKKDLQKNTD